MAPPAFAGPEDQWLRQQMKQFGQTAIGNFNRYLGLNIAGQGTKQFEGIRLTMKVYFDSLEVRYAANLFVNQVDEAGEIEKHPSAMTEAFRLGSELASSGSAPPEKPVNVELF